MASGIFAVLRHGPCDGTTKKISQAVLAAGHTTCSGQTYIFVGPVSRGSNEYYFDYQAGASTGSAGDATVAPKTHSGWNDLRNVTKHNVHASLKQSHAATSAALRDLAKLPKVRRG